MCFLNSLLFHPMTCHFQWNIAKILPFSFTFPWNYLWFPFLISIYHPQIYHHSQSYLKTLLIALAFFFFRKAFDCIFRQLWIAICAKFIFMMTSRDLIMNGRDFHDDRPKFYYEGLTFLWWAFEIFIMNS